MNDGYNTCECSKCLPFFHSTQNYNSQTAAQLAVTCGFPECAKYLEKAHELQQRPRGIFQDLLPPGPLAPALNGTQSHHAPQQQKIAVISQGLNGGIIPPSHLNGTSDGVSHAMEEDAMDTGDTMMTEEAVGGMPYFAKAGGRGDGAPNGDVLLDSGVVHNHVPVAGRKRGREEVDIECLKRIRRGGRSLSLYTCQPQKVLCVSVFDVNGHCISWLKSETSGTCTQ